MLPVEQKCANWINIHPCFPCVLSPLGASKQCWVTRLVRGPTTPVFKVPVVAEEEGAGHLKGLGRRRVGRLFGLKEVSGMTPTNFGYEIKSESSV